MSVVTVPISETSEGAPGGGSGAAAETVTVASAVYGPFLAEMTAVPAPTAVTLAVVAPSGETAATDGWLDVHVFATDVAVSVWVWPGAKLIDEGQRLKGRGFSACE